MCYCKGACCWEGDYGAPLETSELDILKDLYDLYKPYLTEEGISKLEKEGLKEILVSNEAIYGKFELFSDLFFLKKTAKKFSKKLEI